MKTGCFRGLSWNSLLLFTLWFFVVFIVSFCLRVCEKGVGLDQCLTSAYLCWV